MKTPPPRSAVASVVIALALLHSPRAFASGCPAPPRVPSSALLMNAARSVAPRAELATGAVGDIVVRETREKICATPGVREWLPSFCDTSPTNPPTPQLLQVRDALAVDVARLPMRTVVPLFARDPRQAVLVQLSLLTVDAATRDDDDPSQLATRIALGVANTAGPDCSVALPGGVTEDFRVAGAVVERVAQLSPAASVEEIESAVRTELVRHARSSEGAPLSESRRGGAATLHRAVQDLRRASADRSASNALVRFELTSVILAVSLSIARDEALAVPVGAGRFVNAVARGDVASALGFAAEVLPAEARGAAVPAEVATAVDVAARLATVRDADDVARVARTLLLGPWSEPWLFDVSGLAFQPGGDETKLGGALLVGYSGKSLGVAANGAVGYYDFTNGALSSDTTRTRGGIEGWASFGSDALKGEARLHVEADLHDSNSFDRSTGAAVPFAEETSWFGRTTALAGVRWQPSSRFAGGAWVGPGFSYESYDPLRVTRGATGVPTVAIQSQETFTFAGESRLRAQWNVVPSWFALRAAVDAEYYSLTRESLTITASAGSAASAQAASNAALLELRTRMFADAEVARFAGFVPGLTAGADYFSRSGPDPRSDLVPTFGVGIRRTSF